MKVAINQSVQIETEVHVTIEDITGAIQELIDDLKRSSRTLSINSERQLNFGVGQVLTASHQGLKAITDDMIGLFSVEQRFAVARALREQADRWKAAAGEPSL